jgi:cyclophilin family peptidyl-prolyl cis-trans isomerase
MIPVLSIVGLIVIILVFMFVVNTSAPKSGYLYLTDQNTTDTNKINQDTNTIIGNDVNMNNQNANLIYVIETTKGNIEVELNLTKAPTTVKNFKTYVSGGFYEETVFHRVIPGFMIQGGGFIADGNQKQTMPPIAIESNNGLSNLTGTIAMARTNDPNSATSQFFINTVDNFFLDYSNESNPGYAVFGKVLSGMDVVKVIEDVKTTTKFKYHQDWPVEDVIILDVVIKK